MDDATDPVWAFASSRCEGEVGLRNVGVSVLRDVIFEVTMQSSARFIMKQSEPVETGQARGCVELSASSMRGAPRHRRQVSCPAGIA